MTGDQVHYTAQPHTLSHGPSHSFVTTEDAQTRQKLFEKVAVNDDEESSDEDTDDESDDASNEDDEDSEVDSEDEESEDEVEPQIEEAEIAAAVRLPATPQKPAQVIRAVSEGGVAVQQCLLADDPAGKEPAASRKRSCEASDAQAEPKKRKISDSSAQDGGVAGHVSDKPMNLTSWPEVGKEVPHGLRKRRAELTNYQRDLCEYVDQIQAGAVPYIIVKSLLERVESYIDYTYHMFMGNIAAREANLKDVEKQVATAMQEAVNYTEQVMQKVLVREAKDCAMMRERFTRAYQLAPSEQS